MRTDFIILPTIFMNRIRTRLPLYLSQCYCAVRFVFHHLLLMEIEILIQPDMTNNAKNFGLLQMKCSFHDSSGNENARFLLLITWVCACSCGNVNCVANMNKNRDLWTSCWSRLNKNKTFRSYVIDIVRVEYNVCAHARSTQTSHS